MRISILVGAVLLSFTPFVRAETLVVSAGKYPTMQAALAAAKSGDTILVSSTLTETQPTALLIKTPNLTIRADNAGKGKHMLDGKGFDYSGRGSVPRAIIQFDPGSDGCTLEGFRLVDAHNESHNGAGVRINQANNITIRDCEIWDNDMGIMSNGEAKKGSAANQLIERCIIRKNGNAAEAGYNHNLYLGGTSVTVRACEISESLTGHNLKSRAHQNWIEYNFIHDAANRELDLVDELGNTDIPGSDTVLLGNIIRKAKNMQGNKTVIHFGKDGKADHTGTITLAHNTIETPYISPIVDLSAPGANAALFNNDLRGPRNGQLVNVRAGDKTSRTTGAGNIATGYALDTLAGDVVGWDKLNLPWKAFNKKPEPLLEYGEGGALQPRQLATPGADADKILRR